MKIEIKQRNEDSLIKNIQDKENDCDANSGNSLDLIIDGNDRKVKISESNNINTDNNKIKFEKLENIDKDEIPLKSKNIAYPAGFFSSLTFNWIYKIIKHRTEDNPVKLSSLDEISPKVQSKHIYEQIMINWYGTYNKKVKSKSTGYPLFMT